MRFQILSLFTAAMAATSAVAVLTPNDVVRAIEKITELSEDTTIVAKTIGNPFTLVPNGFRLVSNFKGIIVTATKTIPVITTPLPAPFPVDGQTDICEAFREFVRVHQRLLNIVIGKNGVLSGTPVTSVLAGVLRTLEGGVDKLAFGIIDLVPTCARGARSDLGKLDDTLNRAIDVYS